MNNKHELPEPSFNSDEFAVYNEILRNMDPLDAGDESINIAKAHLQKHINNLIKINHCAKARYQEKVREMIDKPLPGDIKSLGKALEVQLQMEEESLIREIKFLINNWLAAQEDIAELQRQNSLLKKHPRRSSKNDLTFSIN